MDKNKMNKVLGATLLLLLACFVVALVLQLSSLLYTPSKGACNVQVCLKKFLDGPPAHNDEYMAKFLRNKYITPPSNGPLRLANNNIPKDKGFEDLKAYVLDYFKGRRSGRFAVLGAGDGEYQDVTLSLETELGWTGILVEPLQEMYTRLTSKNRDAEICTACISPFSYPTQVKLAYPSFEGISDPHQQMLRYRETKLKQLWQENYKFVEEKVQCIPLANILYASSTITDKVDLLVMDMAGSDLDILLTTNLDWLPDIEMVIAMAHGSDIATEIGGYFMEKNMVVSKIFGTDEKTGRFIITKFQADASLVE